MLAEAPEHVDALRNLGLLAAQLGKTEGAAELLRQAAELEPGNAGLQAELGELYRRLGRLDEAAEACRRAVALGPGLVEGHYNLGVVLQQRREMAAAAGCYERVMALDPGHASAVYNLANIRKEEGRIAEAIAGYRRALALRPDYVEARGNLGLVLAQDGQLEEAAACLERVLALRPKDVVAHNGLGNVRHEQGRLEEAIAAFGRAIELQGDYAIAHSNLGRVLEEAGREAEALASYRRAVEIGAESGAPYLNLGLALARLGREDEARGMFREALERGVDSAEARFHMAAATGVAMPSTAPPAHIVKLFDEMAASFDHHLVEELDYRAPGLLRDAILAAAATGDAGDPLLGDILDLGCGTGLCAPLFKPHARRLVGVDLSPAMIEQARARQLYDELITGELTEILLERPGAFDLVLAADVLVYMGDLSAVFAGAAGALRAGGLFAFSVEVQDEAGYALRPTRRYSHSAEYLRERARAAGWVELSLERAPFRRERGDEVMGLIVVVRKG